MIPKIFATSMVFTLLFISCQEEQQLEIPVEEAFEDPEVLLSQYEEHIYAAENGWEFSWDAKDKGYFAGFMDVDEIGTAALISDLLPQFFNFDMKLRVAKSKPMLSLVAKDVPAFLEDFLAQMDTSFTLLALRGDTIVMRGNQFGANLLMTPATAQKADAYRNNGIQTQIGLLAALENLPYYFKRMYINGAFYDIQFNREWRKVYIHYGNTERYGMFETSFAYTATGIRLKDTFREDVTTIAAADIILDPSVGLLLMVDGAPVPVSNEPAPAAYDRFAAQKFLSNPFRILNLDLGNNTIFPQAYSFSSKGFTVAGQPDAYGVQQIPNYAGMLLFHRWLNNDYGNFQLLLQDGITGYGPTFLEQYSPDGALVRFLYNGSFDEIPPALQPVMIPTIQAFLDENGFYVIKSGPASYDLVSTDATTQKWIRFE